VQRAHGYKNQAEVARLNDKLEELTSASAANADPIDRPFKSWAIMLKGWIREGINLASGKRAYIKVSRNGDGPHPANADEFAAALDEMLEEMPSRISQHQVWLSNQRAQIAEQREGAKSAREVGSAGAQR